MEINYTRRIGKVLLNFISREYIIRIQVHHVDCSYFFFRMNNVVCWFNRVYRNMTLKKNKKQKTLKKFFKNCIRSNLIASPWSSVRKKKGCIMKYESVYSLKYIILMERFMMCLTQYNLSYRCLTF